MDGSRTVCEAKRGAWRDRAHAGASTEDWSFASVFLAAYPYPPKVAKEDWLKVRLSKTREHAE